MSRLMQAGGIIGALLSLFYIVSLDAFYKDFAIFLTQNFTWLHLLIFIPLLFLFFLSRRATTLIPDVDKTAVYFTAGLFAFILEAILLTGALAGIYFQQGHFKYGGGWSAHLAGIATLPYVPLLYLGSPLLVGILIYHAPLIVAGAIALCTGRTEEVERRKRHLHELILAAHKELPGLSRLVSEAEQHLDLAEKEFRERAFHPFWDEIEEATKNLAIYQHRVRLIGSCAAEYQKEANLVAGSSPPFALSTSRLPDARGTADRLAHVVRKAQKDDQFAIIYGQWKTNAILLEGFSTLGTAIYGIGDAITSSIADLSASLHVSADQLMSQIAADVDERRRFEQDALEMLDNIQRGRKPWP